MFQRTPPVLCAVVIAALFPSVALAHGDAGQFGGFISGFTHPFFGLDHVVAMVAVGLWGALLGRPALFVLPIVFPLIMAVGGALGAAGIPLPAVEAGIATSAVVLGTLVAFAAQLPIWVAAAIVGVFAVFHGHAHGTELPAAAGAAAYSIGFVIATGLLHLAGIGLGILGTGAYGRVAIRVLGGGIAVLGLAFLTGAA